MEKKIVYIAAFNNSCGIGDTVEESFKNLIDNTTVKVDFISTKFYKSFPVEVQVSIKKEQKVELKQ